MYIKTQILTETKNKKPFNSDSYFKIVKIKMNAHLYLRKKIIWYYSKPF